MACREPEGCKSMSTIQDPAEKLTFMVNDADQHSTPALYAYERYIDPKDSDKAIRLVMKPDGTGEMLFAGRPAHLKSRDTQLTFSEEQLAALGVTGSGSDERSEIEATGAGGLEVSASTRPTPGALLNRLNPLRELDAEGRIEYAKKYRELQAQLDDPESRLGVMDAQGVQAAVNYAAIGGPENEFENEPDALYANIRAMNRYLAAEWGFTYKSRIFTPPFVSMMDAERAIAELDALMADPHGAPQLIQLSTGPSVHRSPFRPELDPFWARCNEAGINICTHQATVTFYPRQGLEWDEPEVMIGNMDAFQWVLYYADRPAYETVAAAILQGLFSRFPNIKLLLSEQGTVWVPYIVRKMDHAFLLGRRATWGEMDRRPSEYFKTHCFVAPYPEENVDRVIEVVGSDPIVFGSDFPHGEGLPDPSMYLGQLSNCSEEQVSGIMRDNLARFLGTET
jgi:predicted TIM-barrel fold metal-dependent hydrolase